MGLRMDQSIYKNTPPTTPHNPIWSGATKCLPALPHMHRRRVVRCCFASAVLRLRRMLLYTLSRRLSCAADSRIPMFVKICSAEGIGSETKSKRRGPYSPEQLCWISIELLITTGKYWWLLDGNWWLLESIDKILEDYWNHVDDWTIVGN
jgi:hypothetical protein